MNMIDCPRFDRCSASLCPLDAHWRKRVHASGDAICLYAQEAMKPTAEEVLFGPQGEEIRAACATFLAELKAIRDASPMGMPRGTGAVLDSLLGSSERGSRILSGRALLARHTSAAPLQDGISDGQP